MKIFGIQFGSGQKATPTVQAPAVLPDFEYTPPAPVAYVPGSGGHYTTFLATSFDGEKNLGEIGPVTHYLVDHDALRARSWELYLTSDICQLVLRRYDRWVIGVGLKLQAEPKKEVLKSEKIELDDTEAFNTAVEARWQVWADSLMPDYSQMASVHDLASQAYTNAIVGGDVLVILRYDEEGVSVQLIDGAHVGTPMDFSRAGRVAVSPDGNAVRHGIERDERGRVVAYYVRTGMLNYERIMARSSTGLVMAYMVYGLKYRLDSVRGIPLVVAVMESAKKMDRYKEATLGSAEERAKIPYTIEHELASSGENPIARQMARAAGIGKPGDLAPDMNGQPLADKVAATFNKMVLNMPNGSKLNAGSAGTPDTQFRDFFTINIDLVCATIQIPPNVAMSKYDSNFSASRAALKDWEGSLVVERKRFAKQFYQPIYALWLHTQILENKIAAPGYLLATGNRMAVEAYRTARWVGAPVPHIDPLKEVKAEREKLGTAGAHMPLTTMEAATEALNGGESTSNILQFARELNETNDAGIPVSELLGAPSEPEEENK